MPQTVKKLSTTKYMAQLELKEYHHEPSKSSISYSTCHYFKNCNYTVHSSFCNLLSKDFSSLFQWLKAF